MTREMNREQCSHKTDKQEENYEAQRQTEYQSENNVKHIMPKEIFSAPPLPLSPGMGLYCSSSPH